LDSAIYLVIGLCCISGGVGKGKCMVSLSELSQQEAIRYKRQLVLPELGVEGQLKLRAASVLVVGAGGLGSPALLYLAAAGVGRLGVADYDEVELSNLQRQILYGEGDLGRGKAAAAAARLSVLNDTIKLEAINQRVSDANIEALVEHYDIVLDGTDNIETRYLINNACVRLHKPYVYGAVYRWEGVASVLACSEAPCYCCLYPQGSDSQAAADPAQAGVLGAVAGTIGTVQAVETIKLILTGHSSLAGKLLVYDALHMRFELLSLQRNPDCLKCGARS
jgi:sulfur-carrier protein adenylyltransferase/sulfurtransferase